ncbi:MAG: O-antigen ligase family protein [Lachnospiraceae bacterium]|nr:O-antigen ligase family protein [Lachnospiraceae bacterium]
MKSKSNKKINNYRPYRTIFLAVSLAFLTLYPFICRLSLMLIPADEQKLFINTNGYAVDLSCYSKEIALLIFAGIVLLYFIGERIFPDNVESISIDRIKSLRTPLICIGGYGLLTVLSYFFSEHKETALFGVNSEYEGMLAILAYIVVFLFALYYLRPVSIEPAQNKKKLAIEPLKLLRAGIIILCGISCVLGLIEIFWKPMLEFTFIQDLISSDKTRDIAHSIRSENFIGQVSLMFNNSGYCGGFCALMVPVMLSLSLEYGEKTAAKSSESDSRTNSDSRISASCRRNMLLQIICVLITGILLVITVWTRSSVALVSLFISIPLVLVLYGPKRASIKTLAANVLAIAVIAAAVYTLTNVLPNSISHKHEAGLDTTVESWSQADNLQPAADNLPLYRLSKAEITADGALDFWSDDTLLRVSIHPMRFYEAQINYNSADFTECLIFSDGTNEINIGAPAMMKPTSIQEALPGFRLADSRYEAVTIHVDKELVIFDFGYMGTVEFYMTEQGFKAFGQGTELLDEIPQPALTGFEGIYRFATGRGYTWSQTLPILGRCFLLGMGNGNFGFYFRQNEIVGLLNTHGSCKYVIDRPHNWYLQIAVSSGIPALLLVIILFLLYIIRFIKNLKAQLLPSSDRVLLIGIFAGLLAFMLCGMINDSYITVNPLFWLLLGTGMASVN